jgi:hypothetical protein
VVGEQGGASLSRGAHVANPPPCRLGELLDRLVERRDPRPGRLVGAARVAVVGQHRADDVRDVVGIDERLADRAGAEASRPLMSPETLGAGVTIAETLRSARTPAKTPNGGASHHPQTWG